MDISDGPTLQILSLIYVYRFSGDNFWSTVILMHVPRKKQQQTGIKSRKYVPWPYGCCLAGLKK